MTPQDRSIFIIDDDPSILRSVRRLMRSAGYRNVETFDSAEAFLSHALLKEPFLLVLDLLLPGMSGIDLHRHLRESGHSPDTVFISANERELEQARTICPESLAFLQKPLEKGSLLAAVRSAPQAQR